MGMIPLPPLPKLCTGPWNMLSCPFLQSRRTGWCFAEIYQHPCNLSSRSWYWPSPLGLHCGIRKRLGGRLYVGHLLWHGCQVLQDGTRSGWNRLEKIHGGHGLPGTQGDSRNLFGNQGIQCLPRAVDHGACHQAVGSNSRSMVVPLCTNTWQGEGYSSNPMQGRASAGDRSLTGTRIWGLAWGVSILGGSEPGQPGELLRGMSRILASCDMRCKRGWTTLRGVTTRCRSQRHCRRRALYHITLPCPIREMGFK